MIEFLCECKKKVELDKIKKLAYPFNGNILIQLINESWDSWFCIKINNKIFFELTDFAILEFLYFYVNWNIKDNKNFIYNTIESDENPLIAFKHYKEGWIIDSVWKLFSCEEVFSLEQLVGAIDKMISNL